MELRAKLNNISITGGEKMRKTNILLQIALTKHFIPPASAARFPKTNIEELTYCSFFPCLSPRPVCMDG
jgi:hypothetical protein